MVSKEKRNRVITPYKDPTHEILFDLTWGYALWHDKQKIEELCDLMDNVGGTRGIFEMLYEQAVKFQAWWDDLPEDAPEREDYYGQVDCWLAMALNEFTDKEKIMIEETNDAKDQAKAQYESICQMLAALDVDYDRLEELEDSEDLCEDDIAELVRLREAAGDCTSQDEAQERIYEDPLSVQVRSGWEDPGSELTAYEFEILLCTGGPAVRIRGELDEHMQPDRAWMSFQGWGSPWCQYFDAEQATLLAYASHFFYGS